ncbi:MAG: PAS domain S-box protein [Anaerolineales bacterium]
METRGSNNEAISQTKDESPGDKSASTSLESDGLSHEHLSYLRLLYVLVGSIFVAELVAMGIIYVLPGFSYYIVSIIDAGIMTVLIFPVLYFLSFQPLVRHIYRRQRAEQALQKKEELEEKFFNSIDLLIAYMDRDFNFIRVNDAYARVEGQTPADFIGKNHFKLYPHPENERIFRQVIESGEAFSVHEKPFEYLASADRGVTYWDWGLQPVKGPNGVVEGLVLSLLDVTERKRAEDDVRQLSRIVEQTEDTVVVTDCNGVIEYVNPSFERLTGFMKEEALGKKPNILKSGIHDSDFFRNLWDTVLRGDVFQSEIANRKKNGELFYEAKTITPLRNTHGNITHFVATGKDITARKQAEEKLHQAYNELELRIQERTEELQIANSELEDEIHVRWRAEEALLQSAQQLKRAQEIAHLGSWELDLVNNRLTWSDEVYRIFGLQPQEFGVSYEAFLDAVHPDDRAAVDAAYSESIRDGRDSYEIEHRVIKSSTREVRIVHEKCEHFRDENGQITLSVGMVHDITERKRAEAALRESEQKFRSAFAHAAIGFAMTAPNGRFVDANPAYCGLTGYTIDELQTQEFPSLIHPQDRPDNIKLIDQMLSGQIADFVVENRYLRKDADSVWVRKSISLVRNLDGTPQWIIALVEDITKRKQVEEALRNAHDQLELRVQERTQELAIANTELVKEIAERKEIERQLRLQTTAMEAAANGIVITDGHGNIQWANPAILQVAGYDSHELIGKSSRIFRSDQHDEAYYHRMWETILSGQVWRGETINRRKDGTLYMEEQTITPVRADHGQVSHFIAIKQDITERKQAEEKLAQRNRELQIISTAERQQRQFSDALIEAALILNRSLKLNEVLSLILEQIRGAIPYQFADILFLDGESFYDAGHQSEREVPADLEMINHRFQLDSFPILSKMRRTGKPALVFDSLAEPDWTIIEGFEWVRALLSAPLLVENKVIGFVNLFSEQPGFFTQQMSDRLVAFAAHAAAAIQNAWLFEQVQASTERLQSLSRRLVEIQENERRYISRELHDEAGQVLTSLLVDLRLLEKNISEPKILQKIVTEMEGSLNGFIENLHRIAMALRPASLDHVGLVAALRQQAESIAEKHGLKISFTSSGVEERLPTNIETVLYRIVQEALTNIVRHARATRADVMLTVRDGNLIVIIEDDGIGFDPEVAPTGNHLGLFGMRERTEMIDGKLMIESAPGKGTTIMMEVGYADTIGNRR